MPCFLLFFGGLFITNLYQFQGNTYLRLNKLYLVILVKWTGPDVVCTVTGDKTFSMESIFELVLQLNEC
jgi:hypothetical protein